jgi:hypothetical protein
MTVQNTACPLNRFIYGFKVVKRFLKHPVYLFLDVGRTGVESSSHITELIKLAINVN